MLWVPLLPGPGSSIFLCGHLTPVPILRPGQAAPGLWLSLSSLYTFDPQDIVTESNKFDLVGFIPLLRERIYSNNQYARQFIISWVRAGATTLSAAMRASGLVTSL